MDQPGDLELYDQLLGYLAAQGGFEEDHDRGWILLVEFDHRTLRQPLRLHLTPGSLGAHLRATATDAAGVWPDVVPVEAAWRLFTVHLDEAVQTARSEETELVLVTDGVVSVRRDGTRAPLAPEVEEHVALGEYRERVIGHFADRGEATVDGGQLRLHTLDGQALEPALIVRIEADELGRTLRAADDVEAAWSVLLDEIDRVLRVVDPRESELVLTAEGVVTVPRAPVRPAGEPGSESTIDRS